MVEMDYPQGATPLSRDEIKGLLLTHITTRAELDRWELDNINEARTWLKQRKQKNIFNERFIKLLHKKMFCNVWSWAGTFRQSQKSIGIEPYLISVELRKLLNDVKYWTENKTYPQDETAARFHHRLVSIHPFPNGNGRHARLMADTILENIFNKSPFTWGSANLVKTGDDRRCYIAALKKADNHNIKPLLDFVRS